MADNSSDCMSSVAGSSEASSHKTDEIRQSSDNDEQLNADVEEEQSHESASNDLITMEKENPAKPEEVPEENATVAENDKTTTSQEPAETKALEPNNENPLVLTDNESTDKNEEEPEDSDALKANDDECPAKADEEDNPENEQDTAQELEDSEAVKSDDESPVKSDEEDNPEKDQGSSKELENSEGMKADDESPANENEEDTPENEQGIAQELEDSEAVKPNDESPANKNEEDTPENEQGIAQELEDSEAVKPDDESPVKSDEEDNPEKDQGTSKEYEDSEAIAANDGSPAKADEDDNLEKADPEAEELDEPKNIESPSLSQTEISEDHEMSTTGDVEAPSITEGEIDSSKDVDSEKDSLPVQEPADTELEAANNCEKESTEEKMEKSKCENENSGTEDATSAESDLTVDKINSEEIDHSTSADQEKSDSVSAAENDAIDNNMDTQEATSNTQSLTDQNKDMVENDVPDEVMETEESECNDATANEETKAEEVDVLEKKEEEDALQVEKVDSAQDMDTEEMETSEADKNEHKESSTDDKEMERKSEEEEKGEDQEKPSEETKESEEKLEIKETEEKSLDEDKEKEPAVPTSDEKHEVVDLDKSDDVAILGVDKPVIIDEEKKDKTAKTTTPQTKESSKESKSKSPQKCIVCEKVGKCKYNIVRNGDIKHLCDDKCFKIFRANPTSYLKGKTDPASATTNGTPGSNSAGTVCGFCQTVLPSNKANLFNLKYGKEEKSFCTSDCRTEFKKKQKLCSFCNANVTNNASAIVAPVLDGKFMDFCSINCHSKYEKNPPKEIVVEDDVEIVGTSKSTSPGVLTRGATTMSKCSVCGKNSSIKHEVTFNNIHHKLCSDPCFAAFRYANKLAMTACDNCKKICPGENNANSLQFMGNQKKFCNPACMNTFKTKNQKITSCTWCQAKKSNFDMVERIDTNNKTQLFCSLNCLSLYRVNLQATSNQSVTCDQCKKFAPAQYHLTMSDASVRNFCSYNCVMAFQGQFQSPQSGAGRGQAGKPATGSTPNSSSKNSRANRGGSRSSSRVANKNATVTPTTATPGRNQPVQNQNMPLISQVVSLAPDQVIPTSGTTQNQANKGKGNTTMISPGNQATKTVTKTVKETTTQTKVLVQPPPAKTTRNKSTLCKPIPQTKATSCKPHAQNKETQTGDDLITKPALVPIPLPFYIPVPMAMYAIPVPYPVPIPIPIPVPCFIPTTKKSAAGIMKQITKIQSSMPADPFEAELLGMAAALAGDDGDSSSSSEEEFEESLPVPAVMNAQPVQQPPVENNVDMLQLAMRMSMPQSSEPAMDMENALVPTPINPENAPMPTYPNQLEQLHEMVAPETIQRPTRGRGKRRGGSRSSRSNPSKKMKIEDQDQTPEPVQVVPQQPPPDENMVLKFTYGVNAWKHWVMQKNEQLQKASTRSRGRLKLYKSDILACTPDELNFSLCQFVNEVRKPNGEEYAPDSIYYLCLGIQEYIYENGRVDNIFTDVYYDRFTECLDDVIKRYEVRLNAQGLIVCRIEEEHLWESKQLGAHSPFVLLNTLIYFNARYFMLRTPEEHLRLSFSHIMKHWKKTNMPGSRQPGRSVYLRYYAPVHQAEAGNRKRREDLPVFEQGENIENPLRCPVKLYEFYLSKCPESIKNRNDVFYLMPERSCVPDSPVWYSTGSLPIEIMTRMLNRIRVIKEIQEAHLAYQPVGLV